MRIFLLGSGFSASSRCLPTTKDLFPLIMNHPITNSSSADHKFDRSQILLGLHHLYPCLDERDEKHILKNLPSFEEFLSLCYSAISFDSTMYSPNYWRTIYDSSVRHLSWALGTEQQQAIDLMKDDCPVKKFVAKLKIGDVIISFNWDSLLERCLLANGYTNEQLSLTEHDPNKISILKLHGSISWFPLKGGNGFQGGKQPEDVCFKLADGLYCPHDHHFAFEALTSQNIPPRIIPPIASKDPSADSFLLGLWHNAFSVMIEMRKIGGDFIAIGYSLPPEDYHARALIRTAFAVTPKRNCAGKIKSILIDPDSRVAVKYHEQIDSDFQCILEKFSGDEF